MSFQVVQIGLLQISADKSEKILNTLKSDKSKIKRSSGITPSERYLNKLCDQTFLRLWGYPRVFRDQKSNKRSLVGKEICDFLVVFENHLIIFSEKNCSFPNTGDFDLDWSRWVKKTVLDSAGQLFGAERWIKNYPDRIFIDDLCQQKLPIELPPKNQLEIHRIIIAHGSSARCKNLLRGSGSLMINTSIIGKDHLLKVSDGGLPFAVGQIDPRKGFVHVFDDVTLEIVLSNLDTIMDFLNYLDKKEQLIERMNVWAAGEEDLLGYYFRQLNNKGEHDFIFPNDINGVSIDEGFWEDYMNSPERKSKVEADKISYAWDALIEEFSKHIMQGSQYYSVSFGSPDRVLRRMAREPRTRRRLLSKSLLGILNKSSNDYKASRVVYPSKSGDPYYVFLLLPHPHEITEDEYREVRRELLNAYCHVVKFIFPDALDIVGVATESGKGEYRSEDACYLDARIWTEDQQKDAKRLKEELNILNNIKESSSREYEYPINQKTTRKRHKRKSQN